MLTGEPLGTIDDLILPPAEMGYHSTRPCLLAPCDFQALKACGVTFAQSMVERVIDERTAGDPDRADALRQRIGAVIGSSLNNIQAGSDQAAKVKAALIAEGLWSQYLEVGIGPMRRFSLNLNPCQRLVMVRRSALTASRPGVIRNPRWCWP